MENVFRYDDVPIVEVESGKVKGYAFNDVYIYRGIPYAKANRFQMPEKPDKWEGVFEADSYGYACPLLNELVPRKEVIVPHRYWARTEQCQNLNIWTKSLEKDAKRPVLVWIHGGAFSAGSSTEQIAFDGFNMCSIGDVVVVSVNHRVNILGYLDLSPFGEKYKNSANLGQADLVEALHWVHDNIEIFGGDPENVTLFGQSGGGMKITGLMQTPAADGLFQKVVVMSGVMDGKLMAEPKEDGYRIVSAMLKELQIPEDEVEELETIPYRKLVDAYNKVSSEIAKEGGYIGCVPMPNGFYLGEPQWHGFTEHAKTIPMMIGTVFSEFSIESPVKNKYEVSEEEKNQVLEKKFGKQAKEIEELFRQAYPGKYVTDVLEIDRIFREPSKNLAKIHAEAGKAATYLYEFTLEFPYQHGKTAWHCSDIPFFFHNTEKVEVCNIAGITEKLEDNMFQSLIHFAETGNPNHPGIPEWQSVESGKEPTMIFDKRCEVRYNYDDKLLQKCREADLNTVKKNAELKDVRY